ncbi:uncharacterized protein LOC100821550 [Brachypodium distachyon]|uniref:Uncharacterized protein n=1 Tax=Brachypodium distachyon TaxID=15368 RepID=I1HAY1_BRADI|nr:uncharacterized protein LOC100821550 [Brachypodium distachyon]KQK24187.1 hypothetical protein BRADI_1g78630v3 [Brachypodium distachyon]|eukprot:XP_003559050.1 uncharacterized protein LOC100821550 [Brachypodium distachyon]
MAPPPLPLSLRRPSDARRRGPFITLTLVLLLVAAVAYFSFPKAAREPLTTAEPGRCTGIQGVELWGPAVNWGSHHRLPSAAACCASCRATSACDSWVFCGDKRRCGNRFGECWLKKQKDLMAPSVIARGEDVMWTSGLIFRKLQGIVGLETNLGTLHIQLLPDFAPRSVDYFIELLGLHNCAGCRFYRAEGRGHLWDAKGEHVKNAAFGPPYALLQGTMEVDGVAFKEIAKEGCLAVRRGSIAWVGSGPEFMISLANHEEWRDAYSVFGSVVPEDMGIAEEMAMLPTSTDIWSNVTVRVLRDPVYFKVKRRSNASAL